MIPRLFKGEDQPRNQILCDAVNRPVSEEFRNLSDSNQPFPHTATGQTNYVAPSKSFFDSWMYSYNRQLLLNPMRTKMLSSAIIAALGDIILQLATYVSQNYYDMGAGLGGFRYDSLRTLSFFLISGLYGAPVTHYWFDYLNNLPFLQRYSKQTKALTMTLIDQTVGAIAVTSGFFFLYEIVST